MRFAIIGVGGVGGSLGAALLQAGHQVLFVARGSNAQALADRGLEVRHEEKPFRASSVDIVENPAGHPPADAALLCMKRYDLGDALRSNGDWLASCGCAVTLQNGLDAPKVAARLLPPEKVVAGTVQVVAKLIAPAVVLREGDTLMINLAEREGGASARTRRLAEVFSNAGVTAHAHESMQVMLWLKFLMVACSSSINAATRQGFDTLAGNPAMRWLLEIAMQEALDVAGALDVPLPADIQAETRAMLKNVFAFGGKASLLTDLERGNPLEIEWLSGAIHHMGQQTGVPTPLHTAIYQQLLPLAAGLPSRADGVRARLADAGLSESDVSDAISWARSRR